MFTRSPGPITGHRYGIDCGRGERNTRRVIALTLAMMVIEIGAGMLFGSTAPMADGRHMGFARKHADHPDYSLRWSRGLLNDTGKILLDRDVGPNGIETIKRVVESDEASQSCLSRSSCSRYRWARRSEVTIPSTLPPETTGMAEIR